jgi:hypothetical protein
MTNSNFRSNNRNDNRDQRGRQEVPVKFNAIAEKFHSDNELRREMVLGALNLGLDAATRSANAHLRASLDKVSGLSSLFELADALGDQVITHSLNADEEGRLYIAFTSPTPQGQLWGSAERLLRKCLKEKGESSFLDALKKLVLDRQVGPKTAEQMLAASVERLEAGERKPEFVLGMVEALKGAFPEHYKDIQLALRNAELAALRCQVKASQTSSAPAPSPTAPVRKKAMPSTRVAEEDGRAAKSVS